MIVPVPKKAFWRNPLVILNLFLLVFIAGYCIQRDARVVNHYYNTDLRNRIVGARLQKDGKLPYFFHWEDRGESRYADPLARGSSGPNPITASPFFHELLFPFCDFSEKQIEWGWLVFSWILLAGMSVIFFLSSLTCLNRLIVINLAILFPLTEAWKMHIYAGQLYLFVAFLLAAVGLLLIRNNKKHRIAAGFLSAVLILIRPIAVVTAIPYLSRLKFYRSFFLTAAGLVAVYVIYAYTSPFERAVWTDYRQALAAHVTLHQAGPFVPNPETRTDRRLDSLEGINLRQVAQRHAAEPLPYFGESWNVFSMYQYVAKKPMPSWLLNGLLLFSLLCLEALWLRKCRRKTAYSWQFAAFGFSLYLLTEIFSPVHRNQYNTVEWLPVLFILAAFSEPRRTSPALILMACGLFLNMSNTHLIPMRHSIGEVCWLAAGLSVLLPVSKPGTV